MASLTSFGLAICGCLATIYILQRLAIWRRRLPLPPGPKGVPILGNINDLPKSDGRPEFEHWTRLKDEYGPISHLKVIRTHFVIINDASVALELLRDRATRHSSRPIQIFLNDMCGWGRGTGLLPYNNDWKAHRKSMAKFVTSKNGTNAINRVQEAETAHFLLNMLESPENFVRHIRAEAAAVILKMVYGYTTDRGPDALVKIIEITMNDLNNLQHPGKFLVDMLPVLRYVPDWFPGASFKRIAKTALAHTEQASDQPWQFVKQQVREKRAKTSFSTISLAESGSDRALEENNKWAAFTLFAGGSDTTVASLQVFFLVMLLYPEVQAKAQEEIDRVIGTDRLPVSADLERLPYVEAVMKETHRWHSITPMALPHATSEEDIFRGYRIPKGSIILANTWWFTHDPAVYKDPQTFNPDRFITTATHVAETDPRNYIFGYGRRICPGRYVADNAIFMTIAQSLAVFNITKPVVDGKVVEPEVAFTPGLISSPVPYKAIITTRSKVHEELILKSQEMYPWEKSDAKELENVKWSAGI